LTNCESKQDKERGREKGNMKCYQESNGEYWLNIPLSKTSGVMIKLKLKSEKFKMSISVFGQLEEKF
jgi:hypothetical protein